jgi:enoyl-CoA hydratase/carnithine racemase
VNPFVELRFEGPLARLTLKRADKLNALDRAMIDALADAARAIDASSEARVAILSGEGNAFWAGGDIGAWGGLPPLEMWRDWTRAGHRAFEALARLRVPLIAAMTGMRLAAASNWRSSPTFVSLRAELSSVFRNRGSAWRRVGRARRGSRGVSARRSCAAWL